MSEGKSFHKHILDMSHSHCLAVKGDISAAKFAQ